jgi:hypothetical protein
MSTFTLDGVVISEGSVVFDITMGQGRVLRIGDTYVEVLFLNQARCIYKFDGTVGNTRRLFTVPPATISFSSSTQRTLALDILALLGVTLR